jgi:hypothetical protein
MVTTDPDDDFPFDDEAPRARGGREAEESGEDWDRVRDSSGEPRRRKERVLHTRVSEQLSDDIRRAAEDLRVPVSNLVRNVLEEAFGAVERVSDEVGGFLEEVLGETEGARNDLRRLRRRVKSLARRQRRRFARHRAAFGERDDADDDAEDREETVESAARAPERPETPPREEPPQRPPQPSFPDVIGWQPLLANAAASCAACARPLEPGERIYVGATERGLSRTFLCGACLRSRTGA